MQDHSVNREVSPEFEDYLTGLQAWKSHQEELTPAGHNFAEANNLSARLGSGSVATMGTGLAGHPQASALLAQGLMAGLDDHGNQTGDLHHLLTSPDNETWGDFRDYDTSLLQRGGLTDVSFSDLAGTGKTPLRLASVASAQSAAGMERLAAQPLSGLYEKSIFQLQNSNTLVLPLQSENRDISGALGKPLKELTMGPEIERKSVKLDTNLITAGVTLARNDQPVQILQHAKNKQGNVLKDHIPVYKQPLKIDSKGNDFYDDIPLLKDVVLDHIKDPTYKGGLPLIYGKPKHPFRPGSKDRINLERLIGA